MNYWLIMEFRADFEAFPWDVLAELNYDKFDEVKPYLPEGMKVIAVSGKVFTLTWMLMGFNHFAISLIDDKALVADVFNKVAQIQHQSLTEVLSIDPTCMDMHRVKKEFGDKVCLAGNVSNEMLQNADPGDIAARVKELLRDIAPGGGYLLSAGNSVPAWAKYENYKAMIDTGLEYGRYPIQIN